jgi:NTP pyrophosphatase (non-canonical NTP hydrolase)
LYAAVDGYYARYPEGNTPFEIMTRLCEEAGELASAVSHFEGGGAKRAKHGEPNWQALADEIQHVLRTALSLARFSGVEAEHEQGITTTNERLCTQGSIPREIGPSHLGT